MTAGPPSSVDRFVGRADDIQAIASSMRRSRLITITGPGGIGKTRLALEIARRRRGAAAVYFADLSPVLVADQVPASLARAMGTSGSAVHTVADLVEVLGGVSGLLVVDNCEHLIEAAAASILAILEGCAGVRILATSRESLLVRGETTWTLEPLPVDEAVRLFSDRAERVRPHAILDSEEPVEAICRRLEGVPLAIELAAARVLVLSPASILARLEERIDDLAGGNRGVPPRQRSLRAAIEWSFDLLTEAEQRHFSRLAIFPGSFDLEAAEAIALVDLETLSGLVAKSLVSVLRGQAETRYFLLDMLRSFGRAQLDLRGEEESLRQRHLAFFVTRARATDDPRSLGGTEPALQVLGRDIENLRLALAWSVDHDPRAGAFLIGASRQVWLRHDQTQGLAWARRLLDLHQAADEGRVLALLAGAILSIAHQEHPSAIQWLSEVAEVSRVMGRIDLVAAAHLYVGTAAMLARDLPLAEEELARCLELFRSIHAGVGEGRGLGILGVVRFLKGDLEAASELLHQALSLLRANGDVWGQGQALTYLGLTARASGHVPNARRHLADAITTLVPTADLTILGIALACLGALTATSDPVRGLRLGGAAVGLRRRSGGRYPPWTLTDIESARVAGGAALGEEVARREFAVGESLARDRLGALVAGREVRPGPSRLSAREEQVVGLVVSGMTNAEVAGQLHLSARTVENHVFRALTRLGLHSRVQLATWLASDVGGAPPALRR
ncbi:MAG: ATP-binding protein [Candidatus Dormibacteria bacterium]